MFTDWQKKFPLIFAWHSKVIKKLSSEEKNLIDELLSLILEAGLLNATLVDLIIGSSFQVRQLHYLVMKFSKDKYLNQESLALTFSQGSMLGLSRAIELFDYSALSFSSNTIRSFCILTTVLANPLCQTIFDARLRCFSDYSEPKEPLNDPAVAVNIINKLGKYNKQEDRVAVFFDYFAAHRPFPGSQKYIVEIDTADRVTAALDFYCYARVNAINNKQDYLEVKQLINTLKTKGANQALFDFLKYGIAASIENDDMCSTRSYSEHMSAIMKAISKPQSELSDFTEELKKSKGYQEMQTSQMQGQALLTPKISAFEVTQKIDEVSLSH